MLLAEVVDEHHPRRAGDECCDHPIVRVRPDLDRLVAPSVVAAPKDVVVEPDRHGR